MMNSFVFFGCLVLLPSLMEAFAPMDPFEAAKTAAAMSGPAGIAAGAEARAVVECREGFIMVPDEFYKAFESCAVDNKLGDQPLCIHRCAYKKLNLIDDNGKLNEEMVEEVAEKVYKDDATKADGIKKSRASFKADFTFCYKSEAPDWPNTKANKCLGIRKFTRCLKDKNAEVCKQLNKKLSEQPTVAPGKANDYE